MKRYLLKDKVFIALAMLVISMSYSVPCWKLCRCSQCLVMISDAISLEIVVAYLDINFEPSCLHIGQHSMSSLLWWWTLNEHALICDFTSVSACTLIWSIRESWNSGMFWFWCQSTCSCFTVYIHFDMQVFNADTKSKSGWFERHFFQKQNIVHSLHHIHMWLFLMITQNMCTQNW